jgi:putative hemolysin
MSQVIVIIAVVALMIFFNGLYVAAEFATVASRRTRISQLAAGGNKMANLLLPIMENTAALDAYVAACQIGITISSLVLGAYGQNVIAGYLVEPLSGLAGGRLAAESLAFVIVLACITMLQVVMGELFPKSVANQYPEKVALALTVPMRISWIIFSPLVWLFNGSSDLLLRLIGRRLRGSVQAHSPEEIELLVSESYEQGLLDDEERQMLRNAFRLRDLHARQVMVHRTRIVAAPANSSIEDVISLSLAEGYSRILIYNESIDEISGFVHVKDLFRLHVTGEREMAKVIRPVIYAPETMPVIDLWQKLSADRYYLAVVFDEYGGTAGIITFEDLIEEIFGELQDEFDDEMALIARDQNGRVYLRGDLLVTDVNEYLALNLPTDADTLSGVVFSELGRPPVEGDILTVGGINIRVESMVGRGVAEVSLQLASLPGVEHVSEWEMADHE